MELDPATVPPRDRHLLLTGLIVPRPIAWVSTLATDGTPNLAPYSFFALVSSAPATLVVSVGSRGGVPKDTLINAEATGELVVNVVGRELVAEARAHLEARIVQVVPIPDDAGRVENRLIVARVVHVHLDDALFEAPHRVDVRGLDPVARLAGLGYAGMGEFFDLARPEHPGA